MAGKWVEVPTHSGFFVNRQGQIKGPSGKVLRPMATYNGYSYIIADGRRPRKLRIHRAVLLAFVGPPRPGQEVRHLNGNRTDNRLCNLAWGARMENTEARRRHGPLLAGERSALAQLTEVQVREIKTSIGLRSFRSIALDLGVSPSTVSRAAKGKTWASVSPEVTHGS